MAARGRHKIDIQSTTEASEPFVSKWEETFGVKTRQYVDLYSTFSMLWETSALADVTLQSRGATFNAHRVILVSHSTYFRKLFIDEGLGRTGNKSTVSLDVDPKVLNWIMCFIYTGEILDIPCDRCEEIADMAEMFGIRELQLTCQAQLLNKMQATEDNCLLGWSIGYALEDTALINKFQSLALKSVAVVRKQQSFKCLELPAIQAYVTHADLHVSRSDDRLLIALDWLRYDSASRLPEFPVLLKSLPLGQMNPTLIEYLLDNDALLKSHAPSRAVLMDVPSHPLPVAQTEAAPTSPPLMQHTAVMYESTMKIYPPGFGAPYTIIDLPGDMESGWKAAVCALDQQLFISGVRQEKSTMWKYDMTSKTWQTCCKLRLERYYHCMAAVNGQLYVLGGSNSDENITMVTNVEMFTPQNNTVSRAGELKGSDCYNTCCCLSGTSDVVVLGAYDKQSNKQSYIQVYSTTQHKVTHQLQLPHQFESEWMSGLVNVKESLIFTDRAQHVYVCPTQSLYDENPDRVQRLSRYDTLNKRCLLTLDSTNMELFLVGGDEVTDHPVYRASVEAVMKDRDSGWTPVKADWSDYGVCCPGCCYPGASCSIWLPTFNTK